MEDRTDFTYYRLGNVVFRTSEEEGEFWIERWDGKEWSTDPNFLVSVLDNKAKRTSEANARRFIKNENARTRKWRKELARKLRD